MENILAFYDEQKFKDWEHAQTGAPVLTAQHPEFEMWNQGIHARSGAGSRTHSGRIHQLLT